MMNCFQIVGEVKRLDVNSKPTKKGPAAVIVVQYGQDRQRTGQAVQFLNVALLRVPPFVYEKNKDRLKVGSLVDVVGHTQGVLKQVISENYIVNELVVDRLDVNDWVEDEAVAQGADSDAEDAANDAEVQAQAQAQAA